MIVWEWTTEIMHFVGDRSCQITFASVGNQLRYAGDANHSCSSAHERARHHAFATARIENGQPIHTADHLHEAWNDEIQVGVETGRTRLGIGLGISISKLIIGILLELRGHAMLLLHTSCTCFLRAGVPRQHVRLGKLADGPPNTRGERRPIAGAT